VTPNGIPITEYCDQAKFSAQQRLGLFIKVCRAIQHAHQKGIIHRDIKPSNVLITMMEAGPEPKVIDFGVAKASNQQLTEQTLFTAHAQMVGTPLYMSPEQAERTGFDIDTRSDVYSLGVLLYELLTDSTPYRRLNRRRFQRSLPSPQATPRRQPATTPSCRLRWLNLKYYRLRTIQTLNLPTAMSSPTRSRPSTPKQSTTCSPTLTNFYWVTCWRCDGRRD